MSSAVSEMGIVFTYKYLFGCRKDVYVVIISSALRGGSLFVYKSNPATRLERICHEFPG